MTVLKLSPIETRLDQAGVSVLFTVDYARNGKSQHVLLFAINGRADIDDGLRWLAKKTRCIRIEYQSHLFFTWDWETELVQALHDFNLHSSE